MDRLFYILGGSGGGWEIFVILLEMEYFSVSASRDVAEMYICILFCFLGAFL